MTERELHEYAHDLAEDRLHESFDAEAYIVKYISEKYIDKVPESNIDEQIDDINSYFVQYMKSQSIEDLKTMIVHTRQMLSELYHLCDTPEKHELFLSEIRLFTKIGT